MSKPAQRFIIDTEAGKLVSAYNTLSGTTTPSVYVGDTVPVEIYLVRQPGPGAGLISQPFPAGAVVRMAVGSVNAAPTSGTWIIGYGANSTPALAYNITAAELQTALNALASITAAGGVTVDKVGGQYRIAFNSNGARTPFIQGADTLVPASDIQQQILQVGDGSQPEVVLVNLAMRPIALVTSFSSLDPLAGAYSGTGYSITGPASGGGYRLQVSYGQDGVTHTVWTDTIPLAANTQAISQIIYNTLTNDGWGFVSSTNPTTNSWGLSVTQIDVNDWRVDFVAPEFTTPISVVLPTVVGIDITQVTAYDGRKATLGINTVEAVAFLGTKESVRGVLEVEVEADGEVQTILQTSCTVVGQVIANGVYSTVPLSVLLTESVGDARYVRRDAAQSPSAADLDIIWPNLGVTTDGSDTAAAISNASAPSAGNPFATIADIPAAPDLTPYLTKADNLASLASATTARTNLGLGTIATEAAADYLAKADNLSGLASLSTARTNLGLGTMATEAAADYLTKAGNLSGLASTSTARTNLGLGTMAVETASNYLTTATAASTYALLSSFDQGVKTTDNVDFAKVTVTGSGDAFVATDPFVSTTKMTSTGITFPDATVQETRVVQGNQANGSGFSTGGFDTTHYPYEVKVIDDAGTAYWVPARLA